MTLNDVAKRVDEICNEHVRAANVAQEAFQSAMTKLAEDIQAATDMDQQAAAAIALARVNTMTKTLLDAAQ